MTVTAQSPHVLQHEGEPVYFCSAGCKAKFAADPAKYAKRSAPRTARSCLHLQNPRNPPP
ncbi:YHS domain-containing protein [Variovorax durovernensis]